MDFASAGSFKSSLMGWTRASEDTYTFMSTPYQTNGMYIKFPKLNAAVAFAESMGWGYDITMPSKRWHVKKNYSDNFKWKGEAKPVEAYD
jgi:NADH dehydrogenase (ubiquinone) Fe-S protein 4